MIWELRHEHKVGLLIDIAGIPRSTYYYYEKQFKENKPDKYAEIKAEIRRIYDESKGRYGYRRITKELRQHRTKIVWQMRSQIFRQIVQK